jgi:hypothetical protein
MDNCKIGLAFAGNRSERGLLAETDAALKMRLELLLTWEL